MREDLDSAIFPGGLGDDLATAVASFGPDVEDPVGLGGDGLGVEVNVDEAIVNAVNLLPRRLIHTLPALRILLQHMLEKHPALLLEKLGRVFFW